MNEGIAMEELMREITRYLAAIETFRAAGCEPKWRVELRPEEGSIAERLAAHSEPAPQPAH